MCYARFRQDGLITSGHTTNANNALDSWRSAAYIEEGLWLAKSAALTEPLPSNQIRNF